MRLRGRCGCAGRRQDEEISLPELASAIGVEVQSVRCWPVLPATLSARAQAAR